MRFNRRRPRREESWWSGVDDVGKAKTGQGFRLTRAAPETGGLFSCSQRSSESQEATASGRSIAGLADIPAGNGAR